MDETELVDGKIPRLFIDMLTYLDEEQKERLWFLINATPQEIMDDLEEGL